ncbi:hypothetical protein KL932_005320 [Ogataea haglerorum]|nr:hypothetical protein KL914_004522 [Ogataea haglerorum]KAG7733299.1 hypothetical protein KL932_005320 [Ogataea haglerorum]KAG7805655.1 hypothetical protein KL924_004746 [Ogataea haglerorum]
MESLGKSDWPLPASRDDSHGGVLGDSVSYEANIMRRGRLNADTQDTEKKASAEHTSSLDSNKDWWIISESSNRPTGNFPRPDVPTEVALSEQTKPVNRMSLSSMINADECNTTRTRSPSHIQSSNIITGGELHKGTPGCMEHDTSNNSNALQESEASKKLVSLRSSEQNSDQKESTKSARNKSSRSKVADPAKGTDKQSKKKLNTSKLESPNVPVNLTVQSKPSSKNDDRIHLQKSMSSLPAPSVLELNESQINRLDENTKEPIIALHIPLVPPGKQPGESQAIFNVMRLCEDKYGFDVMHPNGRISFENMEIDEDIAEDEVQEQNEEDTAEGDEEDDTLRKLGMKFRAGMTDEEKEEMILKEIHRRKMESNKRIGKYDLLDPFIDDEELLFEEQTKNNKDGFYVYYGPISDDNKSTAVKRKPTGSTNASSNKKKKLNTPSMKKAESNSSLITIAPKPSVAKSQTSPGPNKDKISISGSESPLLKAAPDHQVSNEATSTSDSGEEQLKASLTRSEINPQKNNIIVGSLPPL